MNASPSLSGCGESWYVHRDKQLLSLPVLGKSNMGGSPKPAVDNIKEILNINQKRNDYLGEHWPCPLLCCPCRGCQAHSQGAQHLGSLSSETFHPLPPPPAVSYCMKAAECHIEESGVKPPKVSTVGSSLIGCGHGQFLHL